MSANIPASLKQADIARFALRAQQVEGAEPVMAYWCYYWMAQQILQKGLHSADEEALKYTTDLMDKLEKFKNEHANDDTVTDDVAGKALVEQFGVTTFTRADNTVRANKVTKQTADTFLASGVFLELLQIWGPLEPDIVQKIKYGKFHAVRIVKAFKAGEDPNLSNPELEPASEQVLPPLDPKDPEVQLLNGGSKDRQPSVVEAPDDSDALQARLAAQSSTNESIHPSRAPSVPPPNETIPAQGTSTSVSPLPRDAADFYNPDQNKSSPVSPDRQPSVGGNYFPRMPAPTSGHVQAEPPPTLPSAPVDLDDSGPALDLPSAPPDFDTGPNLPATPTTFAHARPPAPRSPLDSFQAPLTPGQPTIAFAPPPSSVQAPRQLPRAGPNPFSPPIPSPSVPTAQPFVRPPVIAPTQPAYVPASQSVTNTNVVLDEEAMMKAQKHARWAISALNFEDVPTAIKEFQFALQALGAR